MAVYQAHMCFALKARCWFHLPKPENLEVSIFASRLSAMREGMMATYLSSSRASAKAPLACTLGLELLFPSSESSTVVGVSADEPPTSSGERSALTWSSFDAFPSKLLFKGWYTSSCPSRFSWSCNWGCICPFGNASTVLASERWSSLGWAWLSSSLCAKSFWAGLSGRLAKLSFPLKFSVSLGRLGNWDPGCKLWPVDFFRFEYPAKDASSPPAQEHHVRFSSTHDREKYEGHWL